LRVAQAIRVDSGEIGYFGPKPPPTSPVTSRNFSFGQLSTCSHISRCGICTPCDEKVTVTRSLAGS
jgi:hypothetical protein